MPKSWCSTANNAMSVRFAALGALSLLQLAGRGYNILLVARGKEGLKRAAKELAEASR